MKKTQKKLDKTEMFWTNTGTSSPLVKQKKELYKLNQSINQKTERSERDVINSINFTLGALFILQGLTLFFVIIGV